MTQQTAVFRLTSVETTSGGSAETGRMPSGVCECGGGFSKASRQISEKRILVWIAERMPPWADSDDLTILGFASMWLACGSLHYRALGPHRPAARHTEPRGSIGFGDSLDGTLARVRNRQRPRYGFLRRPHD